LIYLLSSSLRGFLYSPVTSSLLDPNIVLNILFSITLSLRNTPHKQVEDGTDRVFRNVGI
jgi:hypothetical protein